MLVVCSRAFWLNKLVLFCYYLKSSSMLISHTLHRLFPARNPSPRCTLFVLGRWHSPSVLVFDNLDKISAAEVEHADSFRQRHITELFLIQYSSNTRFAPSNFRGIVLLATAESQTSVHVLLHTLHVFQDVV